MVFGMCQNTTKQVFIKKSRKVGVGRLAQGIAIDSMGGTFQTTGPQLPSKGPYLGLTSQGGEKRGAGVKDAP